MNLKHGFATLAGRNSTNPRWKAHYTWLSLRARCDRPNRRDYADYGGRGITYDPRWSEFQNFVDDMGLPPAGASIDRIDNDGPYCKANCRWASRKEQNRNRRMNHYLEHGGQRMTIVEWADRLGVKPRLISVRLGRGWSVADALSRPPDVTVGRFKGK